jgi:carbonyl reductase 1
MTNHNSLRTCTLCSLCLWLLFAPPPTLAAAFLGRVNRTTNPICITSLCASSGGGANNSNDKEAVMSSQQPQMKAVLVTGANKGIGKAICQRLLEEYPDVIVLLGSRDQGRGQAAVDDLLKSTTAGVATKDRIFCVPLDTSSDASVQAAVPIVQQLCTSQLYGIVNNAGIMKRGDVQECNNVNYFGIRRVNDAFLPMLTRPGGRIVNIASASGPIFISNSRSSGSIEAKVAKKLSQPWTIRGGVAELDVIARDAQMISSGCDAYGFSKALVSAYTWCLAKEHDADGLIINAVTPGYIKTDMTRGGGATNPPSMGAIPPTWLLMDASLTDVPTGRYYGSDCKRSPLDVYRGPGDAVYEGPDWK